MLGRQSTTNLRKHVEEEAIKLIGEWPGFKPGIGKPEKKNDPSWQLIVRLEGLAERAGDTLLVESATIAEGQHPPPKPGEVDRACIVSMQLHRLGSGPKGAASKYEGHALVRKNVPAAEAPVELMLEATRRAAADITAAIELEDASDAELVKTLTESKDRVKRARAIGMVRDRKIRSATKALIEIARNEDEDQALVLPAIGALVALKDESAVGALIDAGRRRSGPYVTQIVFAVAAIGGKEAHAWLITVSAGHSDPNVRKAAQQALEELERRMENKEPAK